MSDLHPATCDVVIVGSGAGGCAAAYTLAKAGLQVVLIEKGPEIPKPDVVQSRYWQYIQSFKSSELWHDGCHQSVAPEEYFNLGGKTRWYGAGLMRYERHEFEADEAYQCPAWPISYDDLKPYYEQAEQLLGVRSFAPENDLSVLTKRLAARGHWRSLPLPQALPADIKEAYEAQRGAMDSSVFLANHRACAASAFLAPVRDLPNLSVVLNQSVQTLLAHPEQPTRMRGVRLNDGREVQARAVVLAAGALHSPRLLQTYVAQQGLQQTLACALHIGRYLKLHLYTVVLAVSAAPKQDFMRSAVLFLNDAFVHSRVEPMRLNASDMTAMIPKVMPRFLARKVADRALAFLVQTEDGSSDQNKIMQTKDGSVYDYDAARTPKALHEHQLAVADFSQALRQVGAFTKIRRVDSSVTAHACGTLIAGRDPAHSVVDAQGRVHGMQNLWVVDGSVLPRSGRLTPSLSIFAWSLRASQILAAQLKPTAC